MSLVQMRIDFENGIYTTNNYEADMDYRHAQKVFLAAYELVLSRTVFENDIHTTERLLGIHGILVITGRILS